VKLLKFLSGCETLRELYGKDHIDPKLEFTRTRICKELNWNDEPSKRWLAYFEEQRFIESRLDKNQKQRGFKLSMPGIPKYRIALLGLKVLEQMFVKGIYREPTNSEYQTMGIMRQPALNEIGDKVRAAEASMEYKIMGRTMREEFIPLLRSKFPEKPKDPLVAANKPK
jgi:hypothetical protein